MLSLEDIKFADSSGLRLGSERIALRAFTQDDVPNVAELAGDPRVAATTTHIPHPYTLAHAQQWIAGHAEQQEAGKALHWAIVEQETGQLLGAISLEISVQDATAHMGYWIGTAYWRQGFGFAAAKRVSLWAQKLGVEKLAARCLASNQGSIKILQRCGFVQEGLLKSHVRRGGIRQDMMCFGRMA